MSKTRNHIASGCKIPIFKMLGRQRRLGNAQLQCFAQNLRNIVILLTIQQQILYTNCFIIQKWIINMEISTENYSPTSRDLRMKIPLTDPVLIQIQIFQPLIARQNILGCSECLLVLNWSRITKQNSKRICCCWDNQNFLWKLKTTAGGEPRSKSPSQIRAAECFWFTALLVRVMASTQHQSAVEMR